MAFQNLQILLLLGSLVACNSQIQLAEPDAEGHPDLSPDSDTWKNSKFRREISTAKRVQFVKNSDFGPGQLPRRVGIGVPKVTVTQNEVRGILGSNVTLECFIESFPKATNYWMKNELERLDPKENVGKYFITEDNFKHMEFGDRFRLEIINVDPNDLGNTFRCVSSNEAGTRNGLVRILVPSYLETKGYPESGELRVSLKSQVMLQCEVKGYPLARTYWIQKSTGKQLLWTEDYHVTEHKISSVHYVSTLHFRSIEKIDFTTFTCISKNSFGESRHEFRIIQKSSSWLRTWSSGITIRPSLASWQCFLIVAVIYILDLKI